MLLDTQIDWLVDKLIQEYPWLENKTARNAPEVSGRDFLRARICWGIPRGFVYWWSDQLGTFGGILIRPVNDQILERGLYDYWGTILDYDERGDICWVDFAYGPGLYPKMLALCRTTGCTRLGWRHRGRVHLLPIERLPAKGMRLAFHI
jgi:hypothetical protein